MKFEQLEIISGEATRFSAFFLKKKNPKIDNTGGLLMAKKTIKDVDLKDKKSLSVLTLTFR